MRPDPFRHEPVRPLRDPCGGDRRHEPDHADEQRAAVGSERERDDAVAKRLVARPRLVGVASASLISPKPSAAPRPVASPTVFEYHPIRVSLEAPLDSQNGYLTPNERFFVCNSGTTPIIDADDHVIRVHGDGVANELELSIADLEAMPQRLDQRRWPRWPRMSGVWHFRSCISHPSWKECRCTVSTMPA